MRYIKKGNPPYHLEKRRQKEPIPINPGSAWKNFRVTEEMRNRLKLEQYDLCAYCEISLNELGTHIEHVKPKNQFPELTFDYSNLVLSCLEVVNIDVLPYNEITCGHYKDRKNRENGITYDEQLFISPREPDCQRYFFYDPNGKVRPHPRLSSEEQTRALYTINLLGLNNKRLIRLRRERLEQLIPIIDELQNEPEALRYFADMELCLTGEHLQPFHSACLQQFGALGREIVEQCLGEPEFEN